MKTDRYTKVVLTVIALCLLWLCFQETSGKPVKLGHQGLREKLNDAQSVIVVNPVEVSGEVEVSNTVDVSGSVEIDGSVDINGPLEINDPVEVFGSVDVEGSPGGQPVSVEIER
jgi:cytoskeletal protein CcmA (bactofilin family)